MSHGSHNPISRFPSALPAQNLSDEGLLHKAHRDADNRPVMGGISLLAKLGQGGMGAVYYGIHPRLNMEVAVKVLPFHLADQSPDMIRRFFGEAQIAARVQSDHIVRVIDVNEESGVYYLVMEFVRGMSAAGVLKALQKGEYVADVPGVKTSAASGGTPALAVPAALAIVTGASRGLAAAHGNGVIHRDIKPDNIMIPRGPRRDPLVEPPLELPRAKLADLGLAKQDDGASMGTMSQMAMGTPGYMSPEQVRDAKRATTRSDVFSMGATLYALLAGRMPFAGSGVGDVLIKTVSAPHDPLVAIRPDVPAPVCALIDQCLDKDPANRPADGADLLERLLALGSAGTSGGAGGSTPATRAPAAVENPSSRGYAAAATVQPSPATNAPTVGVLPVKPSGNRNLVLILAAVAVLLLLMAGGGAAAYWFGVMVPAREEYLRMVQAGHERFVAAKQEHASGALNDEDYLTRLQGALAFVYDALNKDHTGVEAQREQEEINAERDRMLVQISEGKTKTEARFHDLYNQAILKEAGAKAAVEEKAAIDLWRQAADLYGQALALQPANAEVAADQARAKHHLASYAQQMNQDLQKLAADAAALEKKADEETDLAVARTLWNDTVAAWGKVRQLTPEHPGAVAGIARAKEALADIAKREEGEITMLVLAAQVAADRGAVAKDPERALEDWTAALNGYEKAVALRPKDNAIKTKRDAALKRKTQWESFFVFLKEGEAQGHKFFTAHSVEAMNAAAAACLAAFQGAAAISPDDLTRQKVDIVKEFPGLVAQLQAGLKAYGEGDTWNAQQIFQKVTNANSSIALAWVLQARAVADLEVGEETIAADTRDKIGAMYEHATNIDPVYTEAWLEWGRLLEKSEAEITAEDEGADDFDLAVLHATEKYARAAAADPQSVEAWTAWAHGLKALAQSGLAIQKLQHVLEQNPKQADIHGQIAVCFTDLACYELAVAAYEKALALDPERGDFWRDCAMALEAAGRWEEAQVKCKKAVELMPDAPECAELAATIAMKVTERQALEKDCSRLKELSAAGALSVADACLWVAKLQELGRLGEAASRCRSSAAKNPESAEIRIASSGILYAMGDYEGAVKELERAAELGPLDEATTKKLSSYKVSVESEQQTRKQFADYAKTLEANPHDADTLHSWASDLYYMNRDDEALIKIKRAIELAPDNSLYLELRWSIEDDILYRARLRK